MVGNGWLARGPYIALFLMLCIPAVPVIGTIRDNPDAPQGSDYRDYEARCADCLALASGEEGGQSEERRQYCEGEQPDWYNLAAQYRSADAAESGRYAAWFAAFLTGIGVLLIGGTLVYTAKTLKEAESATAAIIKDQRPWLKIEQFGIDSDDYIPFVRLKNIGKSPAIEINIYALIISRPSDQIELSERLNDTEKTAPQHIQYAVLPNDYGTFVLTDSLHTNYEDVAPAGHIYCVLAKYSGTGCENGRSFGIWYYSFEGGEADKYEEEENARQYT